MEVKAAVPPAVVSDDDEDYQSRWGRGWVRRRQKKV
jgi:hypothetical protein